MVCRAWLQVALAMVVSLVMLPECGAAEQLDSARPVAPAAKELRVGALRVGRVLFLGNSITLHGPAPKIGWTGNWGMAASSLEKDYVHVLTAQIAKAAGGMPEVKAKNIADFERNLDAFNVTEGLKDELEFQADLIIVAIGENSAALATDEAKLRFKTSFDKLLAELKRHGNPTLIVRSQFWADAAKDERMKQACLDAGGTFVDISKLGADEANFARSERKFEHAGVAGHPGDKGMQALADELWKAIQKRATPESVNQD
ncbi:MAG: SGNH/GDSL hydrolase family protein [Planctomycetota bacterium]|nr:MAG: SGNH/GDSL hydrolase family protein [Planctomycetota bacterium]